MNELDTSAAITAAIQAERSRCIQLFEMSMPGFEQLVESAIAQGWTIEQAAHRIMLEMRDRGVKLATIAAEASPAVPFAPASEPRGRGGLARAAARLAQEGKSP